MKRNDCGINNGGNWNINYYDYYDCEINIGGNWSINGHKIIHPSLLNPNNLINFTIETEEEKLLSKIYDCDEFDNFVYDPNLYGEI